MADIPSAEQIAGMRPDQLIALERRLRTDAWRAGFRLRKSRRKSRTEQPYTLFHRRLQRVLYTEEFGSQLTLAEAAQWLWGEGKTKETNEKACD